LKQAEKGQTGQDVVFDWKAVLERIKSHSPPDWLFSIEVTRTEGRKITLGAKSQFQALWAKNHYLPLINETAGNLYGK